MAGMLVWGVPYVIMPMGAVFPFMESNAVCVQSPDDRVLGQRTSAEPFPMRLLRDNDLGLGKQPRLQVSVDGLLLSCCSAKSQGRSSLQLLCLGPVRLARLFSGELMPWRG